jgi:hypothetical protein
VKCLHLRVDGQSSSVSIWSRGHCLTVDVDTWRTFVPRCVFCLDIVENKFPEHVSPQVIGMYPHRMSRSRAPCPLINST